MPLRLRIVTAYDTIYLHQSSFWKGADFNCGSRRAVFGTILFIDPVKLDEIFHIRQEDIGSAWCLVCFLLLYVL